MTKTHEELCRELVELNGRHWHEWVSQSISVVAPNICKTCRLIDNFNRPNPTFSNPRDILELMMKRKDYYYFIKSRANRILSGQTVNVLIEFIKSDLLQDDKLLTAAVDWCQEYKEGA